MHYAYVARLAISAFAAVWCGSSEVQGQMASFTPAANDLTNSAEVQRQLPPGKTPGTFAFSQSVAVTFTQEPAYSTDLTLSDYCYTKIKGFRVADDKPMILSADLPPGGYWISQSNVTPANTNPYLSTACEKIFINSSGLVSTPKSDWIFRHQKIMTVLSPEPRGITTVLTKQLVLAWPAMTCATRYHVLWQVDSDFETVVEKGRSDTAGTSFTLPREAIPDRMYEWTVLADDQAGQVGYYPTAYFYTEGGAEVFHKLLETYPAKSRGLPYLGFIPRKLVAEPGMPAGILVDNVGAGTPALQAGIVPGDILTKFNGNPLDHVSVVDYLKMIRAKKVGDEVTLEIVQHGKIKSVGATVGAIP